MSDTTARASFVDRRSDSPRTMNSSSIVRASRLHASTICSSVTTHFRGTSRRWASSSRQAATSRAAESCRRDSWDTRLSRRKRSRSFAS